MIYQLDTFLDGVPSQDMKLSVVERPEIPTPERTVEYTAVDGRHGSLTKLGGFKDISITVEYNVLEMMNIKPIIRNVRGYFFNAKTLRFSDDDVYYKIKDVVVDAMTNSDAEYGDFKVVFTCDPFQYLVTRAVTLTEPAVLRNIGTIEAEPVMKIYGAGNVEVSVNGEKFKINNLNEHVTIDSELLEAYRDDLSMNDHMIGDFPIFKVGNNNITWNGSISKIEIDPGWRFI